GRLAEGRLLRRGRGRNADLGIAPPRAGLCRQLRRSPVVDRPVSAIEAQPGRGPAWAPVYGRTVGIGASQAMAPIAAEFAGRSSSVPEGVYLSRKTASRCHVSPSRH